MERLRGFAFDDVASMHRAGIDTTAVLRAGLIACLEGAMLYGVFHGDLHGGNLLVEADGRTVLFDFGITGRLTEPQRLAFLRLLLTGTAGDVKGQIAALRDLGAFPSDTDLDAVFIDLELDQPVKDPTQMSATEMVDELQELVKKLLGYGARAPKELMLFVKNLMFLNAATAALAPDLDLIEEIVHIHQYFITHHGDRLARELGLDPTAARVEVDAIKAGHHLESDGHQAASSPLTPEGSPGLGAPNSGGARAAPDAGPLRASRRRPRGPDPDRVGAARLRRPEDGAPVAR